MRASSRVITMLIPVLMAAESRGQVLDQARLLEKSLESKALQEMATGGKQMFDGLASLPLEAAINPGEYLLGPSDLLQISVWGPTDISFPVPVGPEGNVVIPTIGDFPVLGMTLAAAKARITDEIRRKYQLGSVSVSLLRPRTFRVSLAGVVPRPGSYTATAVDRVDRVVREGSLTVLPTPTVPILPSYGQTDPLQQSRSYDLPAVHLQTGYYEHSSTRNIRLVRRSGDTLKVDIPKYYATGSGFLNPYLLDGDMVVVPRRDLEHASFGIYGAVNSPGLLEFVDGDRLSDAVLLANGFTPRADVHRVTIMRMRTGEAIPEEMVVDFEQVRGGVQPDPLLAAGDRILVRSLVQSPQYGVVYVGGEVHNPGMYPIVRGSTLLSKILSHAGGLTALASPRASVVMRRELEKTSEGVLGTQIELMRKTRSHQILPPDSAYFTLNTLIGRHPVVVDFEQLLVRKDSAADVPLRDGDLIFIGSEVSRVLVQGQVGNPGYVPYMEGAGLEQYVAAAGGYSELAIPSEARIIKRGTLEWTEPEKTTVEPGDQVWVPKKKVYDFPEYMTIFRDVVSATAALATVVILAIQVSKQ